MKREFGAQVELIKGSHGIFDVKANGKLVYSKESTGRFPESGEVTAVLKSKK